MAELLSFGAWLKQMRKELDLTQEAMAERIGYQGDTIRKIECGMRRPSKQVAELLGDFFRVPTEDRADFVRFARSSEHGYGLFHYPHANGRPSAGDGGAVQAPGATTESQAAECHVTHCHSERSEESLSPRYCLNWNIHHPIHAPKTNFVPGRLIPHCARNDTARLLLA